MYTYICIYIYIHIYYTYACIYIYIYIYTRTTARASRALSFPVASRALRAREIFQWGLTLGLFWRPYL